MNTTLVLGGARSGKSRHAESLLAGAAGARPRIYIATAEALDAEMRDRIRKHRERRGPAWETVEAPLRLPEAIAEAASGGAAVLADCLTLWVSNLMHSGRNVGAETENLIAVLEMVTTPVVLVSNEVGLGIVPENKLARAFRDHGGEVNQRVAAASDRVVFVAAGLPLILKGS